MKLNLSQRLERHILTNNVSQEDLVQIIEVCADYLNLKTRSQYAKENGLSYNGAKNHRRNIKLLGQNFIIED